MNEKEIRAKDIINTYGVSIRTAEKRIRLVKQAYGITGRPIFLSEYNKFFKIDEK